MKKINVTFTATITKPLEIPDELFNDIQEAELTGDWSDTWREMWDTFEKADNKKASIDLWEMQSIEDAKTEEMLVEF